MTTSYDFKIVSLQCCIKNNVRYYFTDSVTVDLNLATEVVNNLRMFLYLFKLFYVLTNKVNIYSNSLYDTILQKRFKYCRLVVVSNNNMAITDGC